MNLVGNFVHTELNMEFFCSFIGSYKEIFLQM